MVHRYHIEGVSGGIPFTYDFPSGENAYSKIRAEEAAKRLLSDPHNNMLRPITEAVLWDDGVALTRLVRKPSQNETANRNHTYSSARAS
jgi:hypothetical protein